MDFLFFPTEFLMKQKKETKSNQLIKLILDKNIIVLNYKENFKQNAWFQFLLFSFPSIQSNVKISIPIQSPRASF